MELLVIWDAIMLIHHMIHCNNFEVLVNLKKSIVKESFPRNCLNVTIKQLYTYILTWWWLLFDSPATSWHIVWMNICMTNEIPWYWLLCRNAASQAVMWSFLYSEGCSCSFCHDVDEIFWPQPIKLLRLGHESDKFLYLCLDLRYF